ncbi:hypothetical protein M8J77_002398 [Diaphorina citri]|nr:hypothetical protein M8J77_002398 [Diaphorina citri]
MITVLIILLIDTVDYSDLMNMEMLMEKVSDPTLLNKTETDANVVAPQGEEPSHGGSSMPIDDGGDSKFLST